MGPYLGSYGDHMGGVRFVKSEVTLYRWSPVRRRGIDPEHEMDPEAPARPASRDRVIREIGNLLPNEQRQRRTCYASCHILYPVSAAHTSIFQMDSNSTSRGRVITGYES